MKRERALKIVLVLVGLLFTAMVYPLVTSVRDGWQANKESALPMMLSLYVTLGIFLLVAAGNPSENRSVIEFAAGSSFAHGAVMAVMSAHRASQGRWHCSRKCRSSSRVDCRWIRYQPPSVSPLPPRTAEGTPPGDQGRATTDHHRS
jgi:hypothetical protein